MTKMFLNKWTLDKVYGRCWIGPIQKCLSLCPMMIGSCAFGTLWREHVWAGKRACYHWHRSTLSLAPGVIWLCLVAACSEMTSLPIWRTGQLHITSNKTYFLTISHHNATGNMGNATVGRARGPCRFNNDTAMVLWIDSLTCSRHIFSQFSADGCSH